MLQSMHTYLLTENAARERTQSKMHESRKVHNILTWHPLESEDT